MNAHKGLNGELQGHLEDKESLVLQEGAGSWKGRGDGAARHERELQSVLRPGAGAGPGASSHGLCGGHGDHTERSGGERGAHCSTSRKRPFNSDFNGKYYTTRLIIIKHHVNTNRFLSRKRWEIHTLYKTGKARPKHC